MNVVFIGAGRVAHHFAKRLYGSETEIVQVYAPTLAHAARVAEQAGCACAASNDLGELRLDADAYIIAISDDALPKMVAALSYMLPKDTRIVHTSGSVASSVFEPYFTNYGVLYPLQSFSLQSEPNWSTLPICLCLAEKNDADFWYKITSILSDNTYTVNDAQRAVLHIAAVFANNFSNYLYTISESMLLQNNLSFGMLKPLILETALKVQNYSPTLMQTGPAARSDDKTITKHLDFLDKNAPEWSEIYALMTQHIQKKDKK